MIGPMFNTLGSQRMPDTDIAYYRMRAREEREAAECSASGERLVHRDLAEAYEVLARDCAQAARADRWNVIASH